jgi:hypothetical protein
MLLFKRFVAVGCVFLHLGSTACASSAYGGARSASPVTYSVDGANTAANLPLAKEQSNSRSFESVLASAPAVAARDSDLWSGGEVDESFTKDAPAREEAPPPPPAPGFTGQSAGPPPVRQTEAPTKLDPASTTPAATGNKGENTRTEVASSSALAPMLVYTGNVQMAVYEVRNSLGEVETLARSLGGFLSKRDDRSIIIRIPAARFEDAMRRIEKLGDMLSRDVQVEDVTEEFNDVDIRLKNARAVRDRLEQLLSKAAKVEESIQIERELERVALLIERLEGRMKFLKDRAAYSTITVTFQPRSAAELGKRPFNLPVPWLYEMGLGRLLAL